MEQNDKILVDINDFEVIDIQPTEIIVVKLDVDNMDACECKNTFDRINEILCKKFPENSIVTIPHSADIETWDKRDIIKYIKHLLEFVYCIEDE